MDNIRQTIIKITIDRWNWDRGEIKNTQDISNDILSYRFQKTIKTPKGSCQIETLPQKDAVHILNAISTMDVVKIYEFNTLKFVGYVTRVSYSGTIDKEGAPHRTGILTVAQFGGLLMDAAVGFGLGTALGVKDGTLQDATVKLNVAIANAVQDGTTYAELITTCVNSFKEYLTDLGGDNFITYMDQYLSISKGMDGNSLSALPRSFELFTGMETSLTFWNVVEQLIEKPFNEFFIDNGPRRVNITGKEVSLDEKSYLIFRETPFDGSVGKSSKTAFRDMEAKYIDRHHLTKFDLGISMDEAYSVYSVKSSAFTLDNIVRMVLGKWNIDEKRIGKYLFKPLITEEYYTRMEKVDATEIEATIGTLENNQQDAADTLRAWFEHNDEYLSGAITHMVPSDESQDPRIGDKVEVYGITGSFYVEGIAHTWTYRGPVVSNLTVTRGFNDKKPINLKDKIFLRNRIK